MDTLWAPWRMKYIKAAIKGGDPCFFCAHLRERRDAKNLILHRGATCLSILNRYPYNTGHLMVAPIAHKATLREFTREEVCEFWDQAQWMQELLDAALAPHGYNLGINLGRVAGAGVLGHLHLHIVPRWDGDTNFMTVVGETKVMPMSLAELYRKLRAAMKARPQAADKKK